MSATAAPTASLPATLLPPHGLSDAAIAELADASIDVDRAATDLRPMLQRFAANGQLDVGLPGSGGTLAQQVAIIARVAQECVVSAFALWAQRMSAEYVITYGGPTSEQFGVALRNAQRPGVSAMAAAFRDASGTAPMPITFQRDGDDVILNGPITWASNLHGDALIVTVARDAESADPMSGERIVLVVPASTPGITIRAADRLLALDSSRSGSLMLSDVRVSAHNIISNDAGGFIDSVTPTFLALQSAFCLGLATAALAATPQPTGVARSQLDEFEHLVTERLRVESTLTHLADQVDSSSQPPAVSYVQIRLDAALLAGAATRLELCLTGGRGYVATSSTARRVREALFLPIQSPTESELRWRLSHSA